MTNVGLPSSRQPLNSSQLREFASWLAETHVVGSGRRHDQLLRRLRQNETILLHSFRIIESAATAKQRIVPAAMWLLDNFHVFEEHIWLARRHLPKSYYHELPLLSAGERSGHLRVYALILEFVHVVDGLVEEKSIREFVESYMRTCSLRIAELWAVPIMLRFALIENARQTASRIATGAIDRQSANRWAEQIASVDRGDADGMFKIISELSASHPHLSIAFLAELAKSLQSLYPAPTMLLTWIEQHLPHPGSSLDDLFRTEGQQEAADQVSMSHAVSSLRAIQAIDWHQFVEDLNNIDPVLISDPMLIYKQMDFATRDRYRHVVEELGRKHHTAEELVARTAISLSLDSQGEHDTNDRRSHVGYYLIDKGRYLLESRLVGKKTIGIRLKNFLDRHKVSLFITGVLLVTAAISVCMISAYMLPSAGPWTIAGMSIACFVAASQASVSLLNWIATLTIQPKRLPRLDFSSGLPENCASIVVIPTMLCTPQTTKRVLQSLEASYLGNLDPELQFALLTDFLDADEEVQADDQKLLEQVVGGIEKLNEKYGRPGYQPFHLCHRPRRWNSVAGRWMGYERKRGKILEFAALLRGRAEKRFARLVGDTSALSRIKYIITLDTDTKLPPGAARLLISTMAHPLNRPTVDPAKGRVVAGYSILQPRLAVDLGSVNRSWFSRLFAGDAGVDPYTREISDVYQDVFGEGSFVGKGILDVDSFLATLGDRFPENWILSHDLIESCYARSGLISDVIFYEDFPAAYQTDVSRRHRWIRGDWQIAPWLFPWAPGQDRRLRPTAISGLSRWKIADNLRRSLVAPAMLVVLILGWTITASPSAWTAFVIVIISLPSMTALLQRFIKKCPDSSWIRHFFQSGSDLLIFLANTLLVLVFLPFEAWRSVDAIARSIFRMIILRRSLLEWNPAHEVERVRSNTLTSYLYTMGPIASLSALGLILLFFKQYTSGSAVVLLSIWTIAPVIAWWISQPFSTASVKISETEKNLLERAARDTWRFFEKYVTAEDNWLPPDNVQFYPNEIIAHRTSPTNIGLYLLTNLAAFDFGFITQDAFLRRTTLTLDTMEKLERYRGHFFNWYDTRSLEPLRPRYISSVDSGNLMACLITLVVAIEQLVEDGLFVSNAYSHESVVRLLRRLREMAECDYSFLYHKTRRLLAIGYDVHDHRLDSSYYDLLASEARLASFFAIATGKLPIEHWYALGRLMNRVGRERVLLSWSGSMFEYLMPSLILPDFEDTLLSESHRAAVKCQQTYGKLRNVPWGFSESGYYATDLNLNFQYRAFGVPGLGFKRGLGNDLVVAPYATFLALSIDPKAACANLRKLADEGMWGEFGFYEAIDYTPERLPPGKSCAVIRSFMTHHQGMAFLGLAHFLLQQPMQRRLLRSPLFQSAALLLEEGLPKVTPFPFYGTEIPPVGLEFDDAAKAVRVYQEPAPPEPALHLLSNGRYHIMISAAGDGCSRWNTIDLTRFRSDALLREHGFFCYFRDTASNYVWSNTYLPTRQESKTYEAIFTEGKAEFRRRDKQFETHTEIAVSPEHDAEIRRIRLTNRSRMSCTIEITSFVPISIADKGEYEAHPTFNALFLETESIDHLGSVLCHRRKRAAQERTPWLCHSLVVHGHTENVNSFETDRYTFLGRGCGVDTPAAIQRELSGKSTSALDPMISIRQTVTLLPFETIVIDGILGVGQDRDQCLELLAALRDRASADRVFDLSWAHSQMILQQLNIRPPAAQIFNRLAGFVLQPHTSMRANAKILMRPHQRGQSGLWGYGISGDLPILLLRVSQGAHIPLLRELLTAHTYWHRKGFETDLVIWNEDESTYRQELHDDITTAIAAMGLNRRAEAHGGIFMIRPNQIPEDDRRLLLSAARIVIDAQNEASLATYVTSKVASIAKTKLASQFNKIVPILNEDAPLNNYKTNLKPGLDKDGREYVFSVSQATPTPLPWVNVLANAEFGTVVSERGSSYTWFENAHEYRLTPWFNDPVSDPSGESFYIQDIESKVFWSPMPWAVSGKSEYLVRHGFGYSVFEHTSAGIFSETWIFVDANNPVKYVLIRIHNKTRKRRRLAVTGVCEWVLGDYRSKTAMHIITSTDAGVIFARNPFLTEGSEKTAFFSAPNSTSLSGDRREIFGDLSNHLFPVFIQRDHLSGVTGPALDPCAALRVPVDLPEGATREVVFMLGAGRDYKHAHELAHIVTSKRPPAGVLRNVRQMWENRLSAVTIETPDLELNALVNGWLLYQTISSRLWGRSGFYQSGGAYGFRDQLQDNLAILHTEPKLARSHLLAAAARQFLEGDVQHWWHPPSGRGVRTAFSDDYLWLPWSVAQYLEVTGDTEILEEQIPFLEGRQLKDGEDSYYDLPNCSETRSSLYEHCLLAIRRACGRIGAHGLPLMGCGDWNDGMNLVGAEGKGESVWLAFFLFDVLRRFTPIAALKCDETMVQFCAEHQSKLKESIERNAWDGNWYIRAFFDDGTPLGAESNSECKIDLLPQAWAVLSGAGARERAIRGMDAVNENLVKKDAQLIQLFDPPFRETNLNPGYIKGYPPGVRENGGQYTHAAIWAIWAFAALGNHHRAWELLDLINPLRRGLSTDGIDRYKTEPYVIAADVYSQPPHTGRGGWTWYTGSAAWMYRLILEGLLGVTRHGQTLQFDPKLNPSWPSCRVIYRYLDTVYHLTLLRGDQGIGVHRIELDGFEVSGNKIQLVDDHKTHIVVINTN